MKLSRATYFDMSILQCLTKLLASAIGSSRFFFSPFSLLTIVHYNLLIGLSTSGFDKGAAYN